MGFLAGENDGVSFHGNLAVRSQGVGALDRNVDGETGPIETFFLHIRYRGLRSQAAYSQHSERSLSVTIADTGKADQMNKVTLVLRIIVITLPTVSGASTETGAGGLSSRTRSRTNIRCSGSG